MQVYAPMTDAPEDEIEYLYTKIHVVHATETLSVNLDRPWWTASQSHLLHPLQLMLEKFSPCHQNIPGCWLRFSPWPACSHHQGEILQQQKGCSTKAIRCLQGSCFQCVVELKNRFELLGTADKQMDELWQEIQSTIIETVEKHIPYKKPEKRRTWLSAKSKSPIKEEQPKLPGTASRDKARRLNAEFQRATRKDKEQYWNQRCKQIEDFQKGHTRHLFTQAYSKLWKFELPSLPAKEQSKTRTGRSWLTNKA